MKSGKKALLSAVIVMVLLLALTTVFGGKITTALKADSSLTKNNQITVKIDSDDAKVILANAEIIEKRLYNFGANEVTMSIEGNVVTYTVNNIEDFETLEKYLYRPGVLSFTSESDSVVDFGQAFTGEKVMDTYQSGETVILSFTSVSDKDVTAAVTTMLLTGNSKLVAWVDKSEDQTYESESKKTSPAYLIAATVSADINGSFYIGVDKDYTEVKSLCNIVNAGALSASVSQLEVKEVESKYGANVIGKLVTFSLITLVIAACYLVVSGKVMGIVEAICLFSYGVGSLISAAFLNCTFSLDSFVLFIVNVGATLLVLGLLNGEFKKQCYETRTVKPSLDDTYQKCFVPMCVGYLLQFIFGIVGQVFFKKAVGDYGMLNMIYGMCGFLFVVVINRFVLDNLALSEKFDRNSFGAKDNNSNANIYSNDKLFNIIVLALALVGGVGLVISKASISLLLSVIIGAIVVGAACYVLNKQTFLAIIVGLLASFLAASSSLLIQTNSTNVVYGFAGSALPLALVYCFFVKQAMNVKGKVSNEKRLEVLNETMNYYNSMLTVSLLLALVSSLVLFVGAIGNVALGIKGSIVIVVIYLVATSLIKKAFYQTNKK